MTGPGGWAEGLDCAELEELAAELALGTVSGTERARALDHVARCGPCRELVDQLARVADTMLSLAPVIDPPAGFESKVLAKMGVASPSARRPAWRRALVGVAAAVLVAALAGAGTAFLAGGDRDPELRTALAVADDGRWSCRATVYGDDPTWLVVSLDRTDDLSASFSVEAVLAGAADPLPVGTFSIEGGHGTLATQVDLPAADLQSVRVLDRSGRVRYEVHLPST